MKDAFRVFKRKSRGGVYYIQNNKTGVQESLGTTDKREAERLLAAKNHGCEATSLNLQLGVTYLTNADPAMGTRTWEQAMAELSSHGIEATQRRCEREMRSSAYNGIREKLIVNTTAEDLRLVLKRGGNATNNY
jgi:hypothetical protein